MRRTDYPAQKLLEAVIAKWPAMLEGIAKALIGRLLRDNAGIGVQKSLSASPHFECRFGLPRIGLVFSRTAVPRRVLTAEEDNS